MPSYLYKKKDVRENITLCLVPTFLDNEQFHDERLWRKTLGHQTTTINICMLTTCLLAYLKPIISYLPPK